MNFYFGNLHSHTWYSDGLGSPGQGFWWARYGARFDFYAVTDHAYDLSEEEWRGTAEQAAKYTENGSFVGLRGFEWSPEYKGTTSGHLNIYNTEAFISCRTLPDLQDMYAWIATHQGVAQFNHPTLQNFQDFSYDPGADGVLWAVETGNKSKGNISNAYLPFYQKALDRGWHVTPTNGQDNHQFFPFFPHRTVILAETLTRDALFDAMQAGRVYSSDDPNLKAVLKLGQHWMGSTVKVPGPSVRLTVFVADDEPITRLEILTENGQCAGMITVDAPQVVWEPEIPVSGDTFFYLKVAGADTLFDQPFHRWQITVTAPIWIQTSQ
jgi:hypothetical protein